VDERRRSQAQKSLEGEIKEWKNMLIHFETEPVSSSEIFKYLLSRGYHIVEEEVFVKSDLPCLHIGMFIKKVQNTVWLKTEWDYWNKCFVKRAIF
jgi:hypothetical protein